jgi:hypothetical protein
MAGIDAVTAITEMRFSPQSAKAAREIQRT